MPAEALIDISIAVQPIFFLRFDAFNAEIYLGQNDQTGS
jgi:hypothetical protein